jgi:alkanesulfonate monooxygenase SsuD/methylene tetrahydromethanopterin reductase-like flavin-dependent oxidoreductase (luciferase family)
MDVALQVGGPYDEVLSAARWAEDLGLVAVALPDHYLGAFGHDAGGTGDAFDALAQLAGLARDTATVQLVVLVTPVTFRHPAVIVKTAVTIDHMSAGRFALGIGTGWLDREHEIFGIPFPDRATRFRMMEDGLAYIRAALAPEGPGHHGNTFQLEAVSIEPKPAGPFPIVVGGVGDEVTPRLAGQYADEYNVYPAAAGRFSARIDRMRRAALDAGRDPDGIQLSSAGQVLAAPTRREYEEQFRERASTLGVAVDELEQHYEYRQTPRGTIDEVVSQISGFRRLGIERFYLQRPVEMDREGDEALIAALQSL